MLFPHHFLQKSPNRPSRGEQCSPPASPETEEWAFLDEGGGGGLVGLGGELEGGGKGEKKTHFCRSGWR